MEKSKTQGFSILLLAALMILANPASAEDYKEVNVSGVTVFLIMTVDSEYTSHKNYTPIEGKPPSCSFRLNDTARDTLLNDLTLKGLNVSELEPEEHEHIYIRLCNSPAIKFESYENVFITYNGWFLIGIEEVINDTTSYSIEDVEEKTRFVKDDLWIKMRNASCYINPTCYEPNELMTITFVKRITPPDITNGHFKSMDKYEVLDTDYNEKLSYFIIKSMPLKIVGRYNKNEGDGRLEYRYYARRENYRGDLLIIRNTKPMLDLSYYPFDLLDFWNYYYEDNYIKKSDNLISEIDKVYNKQFLLRQDIIIGTTNKSWSDRLEYLKIIRKNLSDADERYLELSDNFSDLNDFYEIWKAELESAMDKPNEPTYALFGDEVSKDMDEFRIKLNEIKDTLDRVDKTKINLMNIYYSEFEAAQMEKTIDYAMFAIIVTIVLGIFAIIFQDRTKSRLSWMKWILWAIAFFAFIILIITCYSLSSGIILIPISLPQSIIIVLVFLFISGLCRYFSHRQVKEDNEIDIESLENSITNAINNSSSSNKDSIKSLENSITASIKESTSSNKNSIESLGDRITQEVNKLCSSKESREDKNDNKPSGN